MSYHALDANLKKSHGVCVSDGGVKFENSGKKIRCSRDSKSEIYEVWGSTIQKLLYEFSVHEISLHIHL